MVKRFDKKLWKLHFNVSHIFNAITIRITKGTPRTALPIVLNIFKSGTFSRKLPYLFISVRAISPMTEPKE